MAGSLLRPGAAEARKVASCDRLTHYRAIVSPLWSAQFVQAWARRHRGRTRMNDTSRGEIDTETPVNPYSLLEAVNRSSGSANAAWLIYLALMSYLLITIAGIGHKDLLLNSDIVLPILQVKIELTRFFLFAPILLVLIHVGLISQLVLLARKTLEFAAAIRMLESTDAAHPSPAARARQLLLRAGHRRPRAQPHRRLLPARHVVAHAGGRCRWCCCSTCSSSSCPTTTSPSPGRIASRCWPTSRCWCSSACSCGGWRPRSSAPSGARAGITRRPAVTVMLLAAVAAFSLWSPPSRARPSSGRAEATQRRRPGPTLRRAGPRRRARGLAVRLLPPQPQRHRHRPGGRQGRDAGRAVDQLARPRPALCQARPHRPAPGRHDGRQPRRREPRRRRPARGVDALRRPQRAPAHRQPPRRQLRERARRQLLQGSPVGCEDGGHRPARRAGSRRRSSTAPSSPTRS